MENLPEKSQHDKTGDKHAHHTGGIITAFTDNMSQLIIWLIEILINS